jgi:hypothetical protein
MQFVFNYCLQDEKIYGIIREYYIDTSIPYSLDNIMNTILDKNITNITNIIKEYICDTLCNNLTELITCGNAVLFDETKLRNSMYKNLCFITACVYDCHYIAYCISDKKRYNQLCPKYLDCIVSYKIHNNYNIETIEECESLYNIKDKKIKVPINLSNYEVSNYILDNKFNYVCTLTSRIMFSHNVSDQLNHYIKAGFRDISIFRYIINTGIQENILVLLNNNVELPQDSIQILFEQNDPFVIRKLQKNGYKRNKPSRNPYRYLQ